MISAQTCFHNHSFASAAPSELLKIHACAAGMQPTMRCPCCKAAVHETAFNRIEKKTTFVVGESVLRWGVATRALEKQETPATARIEVTNCQLGRGTAVLLSKSSVDHHAHQAATEQLHWQGYIACVTNWLMPGCHNLAGHVMTLALDLPDASL